MAIGSDRVQPAKYESTASGGDDADAGQLGNPDPINPQEDAIETCGHYFNDASNRDETVYIAREGADLVLRDQNNTTPVSLSTLASGGAPGGSSTEVQYNNNGAFAGSASFTYDGTDVTITGGGVVAATYQGAQDLGPLATDPAGSFAAGDRYFNTTMNTEMRWDAVRSIWLSVEVNEFHFGKSGSTTAGDYYAGSNAVVLSASAGRVPEFDGTVVSMSYTRSGSSSSTFEVQSNGASIATVASTSNVGTDTSLNANFAGGSVLAVVNQAGGAATTDVQGVVRFRWRDQEEEASSPSVVTANLALHIDALDGSSYSGSGTAWNDLSGNGHNFTLVGSPTHDSSTGFFSFGNGKRADLAGTVSTQYGAFEMWFRWPSNSSVSSAYLAQGVNRWLFLGNASGQMPDESIEFFGNVSGALVLDDQQGHTYYKDDLWHQCVCVVDGVDNKIYIDGVAVTTTFRAGSATTTSGYVWHGSYMGIGSQYGSNNYYFDGDIAIVRVYNGSTFSAADVAQNWNAQKSRFGR